MRHEKFYADVFQPKSLKFIPLNNMERNIAGNFNIMLLNKVLALFSWVIFATVMLNYLFFQQIMWKK